jgi:hypothetical protein
MTSQIPQATEEINVAEKLSPTPPGAELFIFDPPDYYAAGDNDVAVVFRHTAALGPEPTDHDGQVQSLIDRYGMAPVDAESDPDVAAVVLVSTETKLTREEIAARAAELGEPLRRAFVRSDKQRTKRLLT